MGQKCPIPALVMAKGTKGLSAQYRKEMSRINRLTYGARKRGFVFDIPYHETRYGISKLKEITSVKQLYKFSTKLVTKPYTGNIERVRGDIAREYERSKSAKQGAITRELKRAFSNEYEGDEFIHSVTERARLSASFPESFVNFGARTKSAREIVRESIGMQRQIDEFRDIVIDDYKEEPEFFPQDDIDELFEDLKNNPPEPLPIPDFTDEAPPDYAKESEEPAFDYQTAESWIDEFIDEARFHDTRVYWAVKDLIDKAIDDYDIFAVANRLQAAYADGVMQRLYETSKPREEGVVDTTELEKYLNASPSSARLEDLSDGYDPFADQSDSDNFYNYFR